MNAKLGVVELWTVSGTGMVISGNRKCITEIAEQLNLPPNRVVNVSRNSYVVGLWGKNLEDYLQHHHREDSLVQISGVEALV